MKSLCYHKRERLGFLVTVLIQGMVVLTLFSAWVCAEETSSTSRENRADLVEKGISQYQRGNLKEAKESLEPAKSASADNADVSYYLGRIYLEENQRSKAIAEWQRYVRMAPDGRDTGKIRQYLTLLLREEAVAYAKQAVANESSLLRDPANDNTVAVTSFSNIGSETLAPLGKGLAAMLISDLSQVPDLQVVERMKLQMLLQEMDLGASGVVDSESVPKVGKLLKSRHVATGSMADSMEERLQIVSAVVDTEKADRIDTREATGALETFFSLEKQIACGIVEDIGRDCNRMPEAFNKVHTRSLAALTSYSVGLDYLDQEKYDLAREQFQKAVEEDPDFDLAKKSLAWTPLSSMLLMSGSQMVSSLSTSVISSAAAAGGISTGWLIGGGVALVGGGIAVAGGGGGGGGDAPGNEPVNIAGDWSGTYSGGAGGAVSLTINQTGGSISGQGTVTGSQCALSGTLTGTVDGNSLEGRISSGDESVSFTVTCTTTSMNGTIEFATAECDGVSGNFSATKTGNATIGW